MSNTGGSKAGGSDPTIDNEAEPSELKELKNTGDSNVTDHNPKNPKIRIVPKEEMLRFQELAWSCYRRAMCHQALQTGYHMMSLIFITIIAVSQAAAGGVGLSSLTGSATTVKAVIVGSLNFLGGIFTVVQGKVNPSTLASLHQISLNQYISIIEQIKNNNYGLEEINFVVISKKVNDVRGNAPSIPDWIIMRKRGKRLCPLWFTCFWQCCFYVFPQRNPFVETEIAYSQSPYRLPTIDDIDCDTLPDPMDIMERQPKGKLLEIKKGKKNKGFFSGILTKRKKQEGT